MAQSFCNLLYHLVFSTKERQRWLGESIRARTHEYLGGVVRGEGGVAIIVGGTADHVHILARLRQDKAVSDVLRNIKANSSRWIHEALGDLPSFAWQGGYGAFSVSQSQIEKVRLYVSQQEEHHKRWSFKEEFVALLRTHKMEFAERYLWV